ncbi:MAG: hypothetical protein ACFFCX_16105 [Candidatus Sifarchaeia archaeon]
MERDSSLVGRGLGEDSFETILKQVLPEADLQILKVVARHQREKDQIPTTRDIQGKLPKSFRLKKTQLYDRLKRLNELGFLLILKVQQPRRYFVNSETITKGVERWVEGQRKSIVHRTMELEKIQRFLKQIDTMGFVTAIEDRLSIEPTSK